MGGAAWCTTKYFMTMHFYNHILDTVVGSAWLDFRLPQQEVILARVYCSPSLDPRGYFHTADGQTWLMTPLDD